jgi:hypothetical protein
MPPMGFEPAIPASEHPHGYALDLTVTGIGALLLRTASNRNTFYIY